MRRRTAVVASALLAFATIAVPGAGRASVPNPTVTGPIGAVGVRGHPLWDSWFRLADVGYEEAEYFVSGVARPYAGTATADAPYTTRIIVTRPVDATDFNAPGLRNC